MIYDLEKVTCVNEGCGIEFYLTTGFARSRKNDHNIFYCPNGHSQYYPQKSDKEIIEDKLKKAEEYRQILEESRKRAWECAEHKKRVISSLHGQITKLKNKGKGE
jgi:hypothetical protein